MILFPRPTLRLHPRPILTIPPRTPAKQFLPSETATMGMPRYWIDRKPRPLEVGNREARAKWRASLPKAELVTVCWLVTSANGGLKSKRAQTWRIAGRPGWWAACGKQRYDDSIGEYLPLHKCIAMRPYGKTSGMSILFERVETIPENAEEQCDATE